jgi:hypothetical protein
MKTSVRIPIYIIFLIILLHVPSAMAQADKLIGVWKLTEVVTTGPDARVISNVQSMISFVNRKHMGILGFLSDKPLPELPQNPTDAQLVATLNSFWARADTYEVNGDTVTLHNIVAKDPNIKPEDIFIVRYKFEADTLIMTVMGDKNDPLENPYTLKFTRLE